jgi:hypothetical protein
MQSETFADHLKAMERENPLAREWLYALSAPMRVGQEISRRLQSLQEPELQHLGEQLRLVLINLAVTLKQHGAGHAVPRH